MTGYQVRPLVSGAEMTAASRVYRRAFGYADAEAAVPAKLLMSLSRHGGLVVGAYAGTELVGFGYAFLARDPVPAGQPPGPVYLFSQAVTVLPQCQGEGVGRLLKWAQREYALAAGIDLIRWTFDPLRARNAHLNFDVLGGSSGTLLPDHYGVDPGGRDRGQASDRLLVDWYLRDPPRPAAPEVTTAAGPGERDGQWLVIPADWDSYRAAVGPAVAQRVRLAVRAGLANAFAAGERAVSCRRHGTDRCAYRLVRSVLE